MSNTFNPSEHLIQLKSRDGSKDYLPVQWRIRWFRDECPNGTIETELVHLDLDKETEEEAFAWNAEKRKSEKYIKTARGVAIFRATVKDGKGGVAMGTKMEKAASFPDFLEKAETGAIGRALAALGYGTQFAPELNEAHRLVDSPVDSQPASLSQITETKQAWSVAYRIPEQQVEERWPKYQMHVLERIVPDTDMTLADLSVLKKDIDQQRKKAMKQAS